LCVFRKRIYPNKQMLNKRILIIDDDVEFCEELAESLESAGYKVAYESEGSRVENIIRGAIYDAIILDYKMPGLNGLDILKKFKTEKIKMKVFFLTGKAHVERQLEEEGLSDMISGLFEKPVNFDHLLEKVRSA
jgi:DNA-binding response OmpR family regulator